MRKRKRPGVDRVESTSGTSLASYGWRIALLLLGSGACALVYQIVWLRALRLVFGTTTAAAATTLAIFLGGLGVGALILGRRADRAANPLRLYARLEVGVAIGALISLPLIALIRHVYLATGGTSTLGPLRATAVRIALCAVVLGLPTFLMGGTLPAAARALEHGADRGRRAVGLLYGMNTLGAVLGTLWATFVSLELWGTTATAISAGVMNLGVAGLAFVMARKIATPLHQESRQRARDRTPKRAERESPRPAAPVWFVLSAAAAVGAAFLLMEIVWYRMLAPILGGSTYTIGLILAIALLGIGIGGLVYGAGRARRRPTLVAFSISCLLEACLIALPYALGDRLALFAMNARASAAGAFPALVLTWAAVTAIVVLPSAIVAGYQFPLLIALLGEREQGVASEIGWAYAANTTGAIVGSLAGGFVLLPWLSAPGLWRAVVCLLGAVAAGSVVIAWRRTPLTHSLVQPALLVAALAMAFVSDGPTAFWRHSAIGAGRAAMLEPGPNGQRLLMHAERAAVLWEAEGRESGIAINRSNAYGLIVDGKSDGNVLGDAPTQMMSGLLAALLHGAPKRALVIGLGSGSTAGWLGAVPSIERVDVVELEPAVLHMAKLSAPVNENILANPKVRIMIGDGREFLLTTRERYDVVFSQPSNPYRAGVASLFTQDFYRAAAARLTPGGIFAQWVQAYEIQPSSVEAVYATLGSVFRAVETWEVAVSGDLLLISSLEPRRYDAADLRERAQAEPYRSAMAHTWGVSGLEGLLSAYVANADFAAARARNAGRVNTDDSTFLEFEFARSLGLPTAVSVEHLRDTAARQGQDRPPMTGTLDRERIREQRGLRMLSAGGAPEDWAPVDPAARARILARRAYAGGNFREAITQWRRQEADAQGPMDLTMLAEILASIADPATERAVGVLRSVQPAEAEAIAALASEAAGDLKGSAQHLMAAFAIYQRNPWAQRDVITRALQLSWRLVAADSTLGAPLFAALGLPFAVSALDVPRLGTRAAIGLRDGAEHLCQSALAPFEPNVPWQQDFLRKRLLCYERIGSPMATWARADLAAFRRASTLFPAIVR